MRQRGKDERISKRGVAERAQRPSENRKPEEQSRHTLEQMLPNAVGEADRAVKCDPEDDRLKSLAQEIEQALTVHAAIEEKFFYPVLRERSEESEDTVDVFEA